MEAFFSTNRHHNRHRVGTQAGFHLLNRAEEVGTLTVHLVDKGQARHFIFIGLTPYGFRLGLHAAYGTINHHRAIQHAHRTLNFYGEVNVSRGVDHIEVMLFKLAGHAFPESGNGSRSNGDAALLLLFHPVGGGCAVMHFAQLVGHAGVEQNAFGGSGFTCINMGRNTDIAIPVNGGFTSHFGRLSKSGLEAEVRECFIGFGHAVYFFAFFHRATTAFGRINQFTRQAQIHGFFTTFAGSIAHPAHRQSQAA